MKRFRAFTIKYMSATNNRPSRVSILDNRYGQKKFIPYDYKQNSIYEMAQSYLEAAGIPIAGMSETEKGYILFSENFETPII